MNSIANEDSTSSHSPNSSPMELNDEPVAEGTAASSKKTVFYGWYIVPITTLTSICTMPGQSVGVAAFNESFRESLNLNATQVSSAYALGTILAATLLPVTGILIDRFGIRWIKAIAVVLLMGACWFTSLANGVVWLFASFFFLRFIAQGSMSLMSSTALAMWFDKRLGRVAGIANVIVVLAMGFSPIMVSALIENFGWRSSYRILGLAVGVILLPLILTVFRNRPEDVGQKQDGLSVAGATKANLSELNGYSVAQALRSRAYWCLIAVNICWSLVGTALIFDVQNFYASKQVTWFTKESPAAIFFVAVAIFNIIGGFLADGFQLKKLMIISMSIMFGSLVLLTVTSGNWLFVAYSLFGVSQGILGAVQATIWVRFFGRKNLGKIKGTAMTAMVAGSSCGPLVSGLFHDYSGSYNNSLPLFACLSLATLVVVLFLKKPAEVNNVIASS